MNKKLVRLCTVVILVCMAATMFAGCGADNKAATDTNAAKDASSASTPASTAEATAAATTAEDKPDISKKVEVVMYLAGDAPVDMPLVADELSKRMEKDLNCTLKINSVSWADWNQKYSLILSAGEKYDLIYTSNWAGFKEYVQKDAFLAIDDLLPKYAPDIMKQVEAAGWEEGKYNGKTYGIPARQTAYLTDAWVIRGDFREKYNVPEVTDFASLEVYLDAVKKNEKDIIPLNIAPGDDLQYITSTQYEYIPGAGSNFVGKNYNELSTISWLLETPEYLDFLKMMKRWNDKGFWSKSVLTNKVLSMDAIVNGKSAAACMNTGQAKSDIERMKSAHPEWKPEFVCFRYKSKAGVHPMVWMADGMAVGKNAENPERGLMVLNKIRSDRDCFDLMFYGIKGRNYELNADGLLTLPAGLTQDKNGYPWVNEGQWGMTVQEFLRRSADEWLDYYKVVMPKLGEFATPDRLAAFGFKDANCKSELTAVNQVISQYGGPLRYGKVADPEKGLKEMMDKIKAAGGDKVKSEMQAQVSAYCKEKGFN